jgi:hypothetical protein
MHMPGTQKGRYSRLAVPFLQELYEVRVIYEFRAMTPQFGAISP